MGCGVDLWGAVREGGEGGFAVDGWVDGWDGEVRWGWE